MAQLDPTHPEASGMMFTHQIKQAKSMQQVAESIEMFNFTAAPDFRLTSYLNLLRVTLSTNTNLYETSDLPKRNHGYSIGRPWSNLAGEEFDVEAKKFQDQHEAPLYPMEEYTLYKFYKLNLASIFTNEIATLTEEPLTDCENEFIEGELHYSLGVLSTLLLQSQSFHREITKLQNSNQADDVEKIFYSELSRRSLSLNGRIVHSLLTLGSRIPSIAGNNDYLNILDQVIDKENEDYTKHSILTAISLQALKIENGTINSYDHLSHLLNRLAKTNFNFRIGSQPWLYSCFDSFLQYYRGSDKYLIPDMAMTILLHINKILRKTDAVFNTDTFRFHLRKKLTQSKDDDDDRKALI